MLTLRRLFAGLWLCGSARLYMRWADDNAIRTQLPHTIGGER
jgi:hypothetical protein